MAPVATLPAQMTTEEMLALPENGVERWLIRGQLHEKPMTVRNRFHSRVMVQVAYLLNHWLQQQPAPRGSVLGGEVGCRLRRTPDSTVGVDVIYLTAAQLAEQHDETTLIDGPPTLVVEILSPNDTQAEINDKIDEYLAAGVPLIWVIDPRRRFVIVHRPNADEQLVAASQELSGEPHLPGFHVPVARLFE